MCRLCENFISRGISDTDLALQRFVAAQKVTIDSTANHYADNECELKVECDTNDISKSSIAMVLDWHVYTADYSDKNDGGKRVTSISRYRHDCVVATDFDAPIRNVSGDARLVRCVSACMKISYKRYGARRSISSEYGRRGAFYRDISILVRDMP